jgi:hypothetical protein
VVEVVGITLVLVLEFVEKVEKVIHEGRRRAEHRCGKPACIEELNLMGGGPAVTISYDDVMGAIQVEDQVVIER